MWYPGSGVVLYCIFPDLCHLSYFESQFWVFLSGCYNLGKKQFCILKYVIVLTALLERKAKKGNTQCEHGQPMEQTRGLFCTCNSGVTGCQSQHQCHFGRMNSIFQAYCTGK